jgi:hypothetical protein
MLAVGDAALVPGDAMQTLAEGLPHGRDEAPGEVIAAQAAKRSETTARTVPTSPLANAGAMGHRAYAQIDHYNLWWGGTAYRIRTGDLRLERAVS